MCLNEYPAACQVNQAPYSLAEDVYACELPQGAVFLDLRSLQYFALDNSSLPLLPEIIRDWRSVVPTRRRPLRVRYPPAANITQLLRAKSFLSFEVQSHPYFTDLPEAHSACSPNWSLHSSLLSQFLMLIRVAIAYVAANRALRSRQLRPFLARLSCGRAMPTSRDHRLLRDPTHVLTLFAKVRVWIYTARSHCLLDSIVLCSVLRKYGYPAHFYIGVDLEPFAAHAWVQIDSLVMDEAVEQVRKFTPILCV